ncbi:4-carboxymuconolactone decarboxylase [Paraburkholderia sp. MM5496-R1]|uniref:carboxymuconolactone decarboxylase family protein n=1 Tax=unclassified Paraburkholderia TaxID=2615204 RepID=UPI003D20B547
MTESVMRFPPLERSAMTERQKAVADEIAAGPRGSLKGPFLVLIHNPELASCVQTVGEHLRFGTAIPKTLIELAILVVAHRWNCQYEWFAHARIAREAGVKEEMISELAVGKMPSSMSPDEALVHRFSVETAWDGRPGEAALDRAEERFGRPTVLDLIAIVGYYTMLAMVLNAAQVPVPEHPIELQKAASIRPMTQVG